MPTIDGARVVADLKRLAEFGRYETGVHRPTYSPIDVASRHWLAEKFAEAGLDPVIDGIGNVFGRAERAARRLLVGSHSETQPNGGWLDGALGVIYGLELARAFAADPRCAGLGIEAVAWADEEGHYGNMLGSRSFTGALGEAEIDGYASRDGGKPAAHALAEAGFAGRPRERGRSGRAISAISKPISSRATRSTPAGCGSASSRASSASGTIASSLTGQQNHAGTTQMARRKDAGVAMVRLATPHPRPLRRDRRRRARCGRSGACCSTPNAPSVVPGRAEMQVQFRDTDTRDPRPLSQRRLSTSWSPRPIAPARAAIDDRADVADRAAAMDAGFQAAIEAAAERHVPGLHLRMPSGAGHDAQVSVATHCAPG